MKTTVDPNGQYEGIADKEAGTGRWSVAFLRYRMCPLV